GATNILKVRLIPQPPGAGSEAEKAVGLSLLLTFYDDEVSAEIHDQARVKADSLAVDANNQVFEIAISASGGEAEQAGGFNGTFSYLQVDNTTLARIDDGAQVAVGSRDVFDGATNTGKSLLVRARDDLKLINVTGGVSIGQSTGVGASISVNNI